MTASRNTTARRPGAAPLRRTRTDVGAVSTSADQGFWQLISRIRPGSNAVWAACGLVGLSLIHFAIPSWFFVGLILTVAVASFIIAGMELQALHWQAKQLQIYRSHAPVVGRNTAFAIVWDVSNHGDQDLSGELREIMPSSSAPGFSIHRFHVGASGGQATISDQYRITQRGRFEIGPIWIRLFGSRGMIELQVACPALSTIKVLPEQFASREELQKDRGAELRLLDKSSRSRQHGAGTEFESLTEFREGDDPRRIDWRATARIQRPVVRRFQIERHRDVMILIDCGRLMGTAADHGTKLDCAIDAALILARVALQSGDRCGIGLYDNEVRGYLPPVSGAKSLHALTDSVYAVQSEFRETDFAPIFARLQSRQGKRSLLVVLSDVSDAETSRQFRASLGSLGRRHVVLFAALRTPLMKRILTDPADSMVDGAKKAVTFRLMRERQLSLQSLKHRGVFVLDVEPNQLTVPLVNQFIELRQRNLL